MNWRRNRDRRIEDDTLLDHIQGIRESAGFRYRARTFLPSVSDCHAIPAVTHPIFRACHRLNESLMTMNWTLVQP
ncbi:MAG: hypothetical protein GKC02_10400 [Methanomassiliicoccales archaeon]|nr:hypothetical protein [Methanomassiliicoccales archaeon]